MAEVVRGRGDTGRNPAPLPLVQDICSGISEHVVVIYCTCRLTRMLQPILLSVVESILVCICEFSHILTTPQLSATITRREAQTGYNNELDGKITEHSGIMLGGKTDARQSPNAV